MIYLGEADSRVHIKCWCEKPEQGAINQAYNLSKLPFVHSHIALMPDTHQGYGMPIGGVMATKDVVVPNAVGVDIGCGMTAMKTSLQEISPDEIKQLFGGSSEYKGGVRSSVPVGFNKHSKKQDILLLPDFNTQTPTPIVDREMDNALKSLGTLGGGNHFIEVQMGSDGFVWVMIHSGSRNLGKQVADYYNSKAVALNEKWYSSVPKEWQLAFLPLDTGIAQEYLTEMEYCGLYARSSRLLMMERVAEALDATFKGVVKSIDLIDVAHNYARWENHSGVNVLVHRKGATSAKEGEIGIIPGSQGTASYIVKGKGNPDSFMSCSHGAGRRMGRKEASRSLDLDGEIDKLNKKGIVHGLRTVKDLDEASGAYKDIDVVMSEQKDLVDILVKLEPLGVIKG